jgi:hypothetical protein
MGAVDRTSQDRSCLDLGNYRFVSLLRCVLSQVRCLVVIGVRLAPRSMFALTRRLVWWAILVIGVLTALVALFEDHHGGAGGGGQMLRAIADTTLRAPPEDAGFMLQIWGYSLSLGGFGLFAYGVYEAVRLHVEAFVARVGRRILNVPDA